jgi:hypothetical protein
MGISRRQSRNWWLSIGICRLKYAISSLSNRNPLRPIALQKRKISKSKAHDLQSGSSTWAARVKEWPSKRFLRRFLFKQIGILPAKFRYLPEGLRFKTDQIAILRS